MKEIIYFDWKGNQSECTTKLWVVQICDLHLFWEAFALWRMKNAINAVFTDIESRFLNVRLFGCPSRYKMVMPLKREIYMAYKSTFIFIQNHTWFYQENIVQPFKN